MLIDHVKVYLHMNGVPWHISVQGKSVPRHKEDKPKEWQVYYKEKVLKYEACVSYTICFVFSEIFSTAKT